MNSINRKRTPKDDIGYGAKATALNEIGIRKYFDDFNDEFSNNYSEFDENELLEDF